MKKMDAQTSTRKAFSRGETKINVFFHLKKKALIILYNLA